MNHSPTYAYRFDDEAAGLAALKAAFNGATDEQLAKTYQTHNGVAVELLGPINDEAWHVNTSAPVPGWEEYQVFPTNPKRVFA